MRDSVIRDRVERRSEFERLPVSRRCYLTSSCRLCSVCMKSSLDFCLVVYCSLLLSKKGLSLCFEQETKTAATSKKSKTSGNREERRGGERSKLRSRLSLRIVCLCRRNGGSVSGCRRRQWLSSLPVVVDVVLVHRLQVVVVPPPRRRVAGMVESMSSLLL